MPIDAGLKLLRERYTLVNKRLEISATSESWIGVGEDDKQFLIRLWPYSEANPPELLRALWDAELRTLYRVASAPGADQSILVIRDAGLDRRARCFVMVLEAELAGGYERLSTALANRNAFAWLRTTDIAVRRDLWRTMARLADGIALLHEQNTLHRNIDAEHVYFSSDIGVESFRLGGFEWSLRLGVSAAGAPPISWSSPPEFFTERSFGYRPETDWYAFGMLATRCFRPLETLEKMGPLERHRRVMRQLENASSKELSDLEKTILIGLITEDAHERFNDPQTIQPMIQEILAGLENNFQPGEDRSRLVLAVNPDNTDLLSYIMDLGFVPNSENVEETYNPRDALHVGRVVSFIQKDLDDAEPSIRISAVRNRSLFILEGQNLVLGITPFQFTDRNSNQTERTWNVAYCSGLAELRGAEASTEFSTPGIEVRSAAEIRKRYPLRISKNWEKYLPRADLAAKLRAGLSKFYSYIRCTNQIELLLMDAEIFAYELVGEPKLQETKQTITIKEIDRSRPMLSVFQKEGGLVEFLQREIVSATATARQVVLSEQDVFFVDAKERRANTWTVQQIDPVNQRVVLSQIVEAEIAPQPARSGYIRAADTFGQLQLIQRRKKAIDRLERHSFLLRSLSAPGQVYMDTGLAPLPVPPLPDQVDSAKRAALEDILRVRPIYVLQGPPGTGKTTLVAHLLRQIFEEDPVAQILITAQAHSAVDVLRSKVRNEAFSTIPDDKLPLSVRIGREGDDEGDPVDGSARQVGLDLLKQARTKFDQIENLSELQQVWLRAINEMLDPKNTSSGVDDFFQTVKRGASITYCTTSAGDLEALADSIQSFDWAIVEEAGKAYAFDLALPLQMGHRWLLIGDHNQLPPYKFDDHEEAIQRLDEVASSLQALPGLNYRTVDFEWLRWWSDLETRDREEFKNYVGRWLNAFKQFYSSCSRSSGEERLTSGTSIGAAAGKLTEQHRMHPTIGDLISTVYYDDELINRTEIAGAPVARVKHPFTSPTGIEDKAIVWVDTEWAARDKQFCERGRPEGETPVTNSMEADALIRFVEDLRADGNKISSCGGGPFELVALAPYVQQVGLLNNLFDRSTLRLPLALMASTSRRRGPPGGGLPYSSQLAHTVDSFQGNQADIVCVSLTRNNYLPPGEGLGFLGERPRLNVLLSRAKRLLVLVGSWDFYKFQVSDVDLSDESHPLWHWKKVLQILDDDFKAKRAVFMPARYSVVESDAAATSH
ncbi:MAG TPA: AAA domain-containing protein [Pseudolabrys sp.]|nr:AAA domain-containing protein [Pseudolabrys sp.]